MKFKNLFFLIISIFCYTIGFAQSAQTKGVISTGESIPHKTFGNATYRITYKMSFVPDPDFPEEKKEALTVLLVGNKYSLFADYYSLEFDSIETSLNAKKENASVQMAKLLPIGKKIKFKPWIIINYPSNGHVLYQQNFGSTTYRYDDNIKFNWHIEDSTKIIEGYKCQKAVCSFRGRTYTAWYCPEVPLNGGPYVFNGLPGLIFSIKDSNNEFSFSLVGLQKQTKNTLIKIPNRNIVQISRKEFRKIEKNLADNPAAVLKLTSGRANIPSDVLKNIQPKPYNPIEKE